MEYWRNKNTNVDEDITFPRVRDSNARACRQIFAIFFPPFISKPTFVADILLSTVSYSLRTAGAQQSNDSLIISARVKARVYNALHYCAAYNCGH
jgi:hypothetical protein